MDAVRTLPDPAHPTELPDLSLPAVELAPLLLGCRLVRLERGRRREGVIVEVEAYPGGADLASHTRLGRRTERNASMWLEGGHAYVYFTYGLHWMFNVVSGPEGSGEAVLVRALEPLDGLPAMRTARTGKSRRAVGEARDAGLCSGPARLTQALGIDRRFDGAWLGEGGPLHLLAPDPAWQSGRGEVLAGPRIGVDYAGRWARERWRFWLAGCGFVSNPRPARGEDGARVWSPRRVGR